MQLLPLPIQSTQVINLPTPLRLRATRIDEHSGTCTAVVNCMTADPVTADNAVDNPDMTTDNPTSDTPIDYHVLLTNSQVLASRIAAIQEIAITINCSLPLKDILALVGEQVKLILYFDFCSVYLRDEEGTTEEIVLTNPSGYDRGVADTPAILHAIDSGESQLIFDSWTSNPDAPFRSQMIVPFVSEDEILGTINFMLRIDNGYTQNDMRIAYLLALQLTTAIRNVQRFTEVQRLNAQLEETLSNLRKLQVLQDNLSHMIVHDLRMPLTLISLNLDMIALRAHKGSFDRQFFGNIEHARNATQQLVSMMEDLLKINKLEVSELKPLLKRSSITSLIKNRLDGYQLQARQEDKSLLVHMADNLPFVMMDVELIGRVLDNLVSNAFKYTAAGGSVSIGASVEDELLSVYVCDDGPGIAAEHHERIFEKFGQVQDPQEEFTRPGTGLGLTFCHLAVQVHRGKIWVESTVGEGSCFRFTLPLR